MANDVYQDLMRKLLEVNFVPGRQFDADMLRDLVRRQEIYAGALSHEPGVLPPLDDRPQARPTLGADGVLRMPGTFLARGERLGLLITASDDLGPDHGIEPLDASDLPEGEHLVHAVLAAETVPFGNLRTEFPDGASASPLHFHESRRPRVALMVGDCRLEQRDWIAVARLVRRREGSRLVTILDPSFSAPILSLRAYAGANPIPGFVELLLARLRESGSTGALGTLLEIQLTILRQTATYAAPWFVHALIANCLMIADTLGIGLQGHSLVQSGFTPSGFPAFLADLLAACETPAPLDRFPKTIEAEIESEMEFFLLRSGALREDGACWVWTPDAPFRANRLLLYLPDARLAQARQAIPQVRYAFERRHLDDPEWATPVGTLRARGAGLGMKPRDTAIAAIFLAAETGTAREQLRQLVHGGACVYSR